MIRLFRSLFQHFCKTETSAGCRPPPQASSVAMLPYGSCNNQYSNDQMFRSFCFKTYMSSLRSYFPRLKLNQEKDQPSTTPFFFFFPGWAKWIFGSLLSLLIPTWKQSWNKLQTLEDEAEMVIEEVENVAEVVEKVAELTEKVSAEIAEKLPEKSKLKQAAQVVENYSKEIAHDAHLTQDILHKVEEWKQKLEKSETAVNEQIKEERHSEKETKGC